MVVGMKHRIPGNFWDDNDHLQEDRDVLPFCHQVSRLQFLQIDVRVGNNPCNQDDNQNSGSSLFGQFAEKDPRLNHENELLGLLQSSLLLHLAF